MDDETVSSAPEVTGAVNTETTVTKDMDVLGDDFFAKERDDDDDGFNDQRETARVEKTEPAEVEKTVEARPMPKSWAKEQQEVWAGMSPKAQEYYELREKQMADGLEQFRGDSGFGKQMREVFTPYKEFLAQQGVDEPKAVQYLLNAHHRLSTATQADKQAYFANLAKSYGIELGNVAAQQTAEVDPNIQAILERTNRLESTIQAREQAEMESYRNKVAADVDAFAKDPKHIYFDECADDIAALIKIGNTLEMAYDKAVYANPVTRAKELARLQTENEKAFREKSSKEAEAARKAAGTNVRSRDTRKAPTEPRGSMDDTMRETLKEIRARTH